MRKLFSLITVLITLSLIGIILIQVSWIKNMIALREEQVKQKIDGVQRAVGAELTQFKEQYMQNEMFNSTGIFPRRYSHDIFRRNSIASRLSSNQLSERVRKAFDNADLKSMNFEYALAPGPWSIFSNAEMQSVNFEASYIDSAINYVPKTWFVISSLSGSATENLTNDEALLIIGLNWRKVVLHSLASNIALAIIFTIVILAAFYVTIYTMLRQKKLSDIKNDFINNMTHEFKTPIATISLAVDALKNEKVIADREKTDYFSGIIKEENQRMNKQVETILKASQFDKEETEIEFKPLHVHQIIENVIENFALQLRDKNGNAELNLQAANDMINADEVHFANLVNNMIDNAVKYSKDNVPIYLKISTSNNNNRLVLKFEDNGIGMSKETQKRVFEKFYRAHTGNLHNVKGFGLGLSYVKSVVQSHHGHVKLESVLGKGTTFILDFPLSGENKM